MNLNSLVRGRGRVLVLAVVVTLGAATLTGVVVLPAFAAVAASVTVNAGQARATIPATAVGMNEAVYDGHMNDAAIPGLLSAAGIGVMRYPGGSYGDIYHWQTNTADGGFVAPNTDFDTFMGTVRATGAQPIIIANYGTGTPDEAAGWVRYANLTKGYGAKYWEIGNEQMGNGEYGATWEADNHSSHSATTYATNVLQYISAMKAVDPTIKIGALLVTPGTWPDGIVGPGDTQDWNHTVMSIAGSAIDFVVVHHYPGSTSEADLLGKPAGEIPGMATALHSLINQYAGGNAANVGIAVTEASALAYKDTAPGGLFAPDEYLTWLENGAFTLDWWDMHNGSDCSQVTTVAGATDYNDGGVLSSGASCEPPLNTPFAPYYGIQLIAKLGGPGDTLVTANSSTALVAAHAVKRANGDVDVMLINKDPNNDATVSLSYNGFTPSALTPTVYSYLKNATSITSTNTGTTTTQTVPAYSAVVVQLHPDNGGGPSASPSSTTSSSPSTAPSVTPSQSPSPSPTNAPPSGSGCSIAYSVVGQWPAGFQGAVTIKNTGATTINGWTLTWTYANGQSITQVWNGTGGTSGASATISNASYNPTIAAGNSTSFGFIGTWNNTTNAAPNAFTLNGANCSLG